MRGEYYPMEYEAWDEGTDTLTLEQEGAYLRFCHMMYRRRKPVIDDKMVLARLWKCHPNKAVKLRSELIAAGKITLDGEGHLTNTRVTQELDRSETRARQKADAGKTGGTRSGVVRRNALENKEPNEAHASANRTKGKESKGEYSEPNGSGAAAPIVVEEKLDYRTALFRDGLGLLTRLTGKPESPARQLLGKWLKSANDDARRVLRTIEDARDQEVAEPVSWIEAALRSRRQSGRTEDLLFARM